MTVLCCLALCSCWGEGSSRAGQFVRCWPTPSVLRNPNPKPILLLGAEKQLSVQEKGLCNRAHARSRRTLLTRWQSLSHKEEHCGEERMDTYLFFQAEYILQPVQSVHRYVRVEYIRIIMHTFVYSTIRPWQNEDTFWRQHCVQRCCPSVAKRSNIVARRVDTRNVSEGFQKHFLCPPQMLRAWKNGSIFRKPLQQ